MTKPTLALQDLAAPDGICFGCGSKNSQGLKIKSYWDEDGTHLIAHYQPAAFYMGWPELVYGGLLSCLIDCHSNWTAMAQHYRVENREIGSLPRIECVTGQLNIRFIKPTPMGVSLFLKARVEGEVKRSTRVLCEVYANDRLTVQGDSILVRVDTSHLAKMARHV